MTRRIPSYKEVLFALGANGIYTLNRVGDVLTFLSVSGGPYVMQIDEGEESDVRAGITYKMPDDAEFKRIMFRDTGGVGGNIRIAVARGSILDARSTITGSFPVQNAEPPDNILDTALAAADPGLVALAAAIDTDLAAIISNQNDDAAKRANLTTLVGATYRGSSGEAAEQTIVAAVTNTNGIIVRRATCTVNARNSVSYFGAGAGNAFVGYKDLAASGAGGGPITWSCENLFIPSGVALVGRAGTTLAENHIWYEVL